ncbi:hypothetical protein [Iningainema tapete]|uniref:DUF2281 domain-containing protein n=1 Tax=Iningainema tapete BLCC-T55 TaxID=2748662 RepID=A0A8J6XHZ7_9CYAN|nr:hypothetical protein [Iningainema tapete]MBD2771051.1 hypothetical protein [Iningainema tapete BLCC-T55]
MTTSVKDSLHNTIETLSEEECQQLLEFIQYLQQTIPSSMKSLLNDPTFNIPAKGFGTFEVIEAIQGEGIAASELLVEDRR